MRTTALIVAVVCSASASGDGLDTSAKTLRLGVFGLFRPKQLTLSAARGESLEIAGVSDQNIAKMHCTLEHGAVSCRAGLDVIRAKCISVIARGTGGIAVTVPGKIERTFHGSLEICTDAGALVPVLTVPLERAVAAAVAAESPPAAPFEALSAQAVVSRSYYVAARRRHALFDFCDTTHCQFVREPPPAESPATQATNATRALVLAWSGALVPALFTASCGGHTRALPDPADGAYPYFPVDCPYCRSAPPPRCSYCVRSTGRWGNRRGSGAGHGFGLCQTGAAGMAAEGSGFRAILERYFPNTRLIVPNGY